MKKLTGAAAAVVLVGSLIAAGCQQTDDDCDARSPGIELAAAHTGKGGGSRGSGRSGGSRSTGRGPSLTKPRGTSPKSPKSHKSSGRHGTSSHGSSHGHGHHDDDWFDCDDD
ncbi:hypothetical protein ABZT06_49665 [Streptomyces sp. NPDC005483]|uniref:hypothetical protein n=1 Tax=Streptomyces sp. NPDC005483 TaxID=3154882 RepID=UPI0033AEAB01